MAYAAVTILLQTLEQLSVPNRGFVLEKNHQLQSLIENLKFLQEFLRNSSLKYSDQEKLTNIEGKIRDAAYKAQDLIEIFVSEYQYSYDQSEVAIDVLDRMSKRFTYAHRYFAVQWFHQLQEEMHIFLKMLRLLTEHQQYFSSRGLNRLLSAYEKLKLIDNFMQKSIIKSMVRSIINDQHWERGKVLELQKSIEAQLEEFLSNNLYQQSRRAASMFTQKQGRYYDFQQHLELIHCIKAEMIKRDENISTNGIKIIVDSILGLYSSRRSGLTVEVDPIEVGHERGRGEEKSYRSSTALSMQSETRKDIDIFDQKHSIYLALEQVLDEISSIKVEVVKIDKKIPTNGSMLKYSSINRFKMTEIYEQKSARKDYNSLQTESLSISCPKQRSLTLLEKVHSTAISPENKGDKEIYSISINQEIHVRKGIDAVSTNQEMNKRKELAQLQLSWETMEENVVVGLDADLYKVKELITGEPFYLQCVTIVGMGGIGKTTLAKVVFDDPYIRYHFYVHAWITVSQVYELRDLLLGLLKAVVCHLDDETYCLSKEQLREKLYRHLKGQRFLIVMDDMWNIEAWDYIRRCFPDDKNGSRILLTTRLKTLAEQVSPNSPPHQMSFLSRDLSWQLLHYRISLQGTCSQELMDIGKKIAEKCKGLPLAIVVVAGVLSKTSETRECWENVAESMNSLLTSDPNKCLGILAMSYNYLPHHLKPCFLYFCAFPEDCEIECWRLIRMWIAEGLVEPQCSTSLEDSAEEYLEDLIKRSLVLIGKRSSNGKIKTCFLHDLVRDLSLREARKENFMHVMMKQVQISSDGSISLRRLSFHSGSSCSVHLEPSIHNTHTFHCFDEGFGINQYIILLSKFMLLRVLDIVHAKFARFPLVILKLTHLRFLALTTAGELPSSIYKLLNLQTLIVDDPSSSKKFNLYSIFSWIWKKSPNFTLGIWLMSHLRHLKLGAAICLPCPSVLQKNSLVLENLQSLSRIRLASCTKKVFKRLPNLKKLVVHQTKEDLDTSDGSSCFLNNLAHLQELETLKCCFFFSPSQTLYLPDWNAFPRRLKTLSISRSNLPWEHVETLGRLPYLEVLKLKNYAFRGPTWDPDEGGFQRLTLLLIEHTDLVHWKASKYNFPCLQYLILRCCASLEEIPHDIGDGLQLLELFHCSSCAESSARDIEEEQRNSDNNDLVVRVTSKRTRRN